MRCPPIPLCREHDASMQSHRALPAYDTRSYAMSGETVAARPHVWADLLRWAADGATCMLPAGQASLTGTAACARGSCAGSPMHSTPTAARAASRMPTGCRRCCVPSVCFLHGHASNQRANLLMQGNSQCPTKHIRQPRPRYLPRNANIEMWQKGACPALRLACARLLL